MSRQTSGPAHPALRRQQRLPIWLSSLLTKEEIWLRCVECPSGCQSAEQGPSRQQKLLTWLSIVLTKEGASLRGVSMPPESS